MRDVVKFNDCMTPEGKIEIDNMLNTTYNNRKKDNVEKYIIEFYSKEDGKMPAKDFILKLDAKMKAKLIRILDLLENNGPIVRYPYSEYLDDGIYEVRAQSGTDITRVLYFFTIGKKIILTNGFVKKTKKTPRRELELAKKYRKDYERRTKK